MDAISLMATAMRAAKRRLDVAASNLANASTDGFARRVARVSLGANGLVATSVRDASQGPLRHTGRSFDLALAGPGSLFVRDVRGRCEASRGGSFSVDAEGRLADERGRVLLGTRGPLRAGADATIDSGGTVREHGAIVGCLRVARGTVVRSGCIEAANVDAIREMIDVLDAQRAFESAQKTLCAVDETRQKDANDVARVKA